MFFINLLWDLITKTSILLYLNAYMIYMIYKYNDYTTTDRLFQFVYLPLVPIFYILYLFYIFQLVIYRNYIFIYELFYAVLYIMCYEFPS